MNNSDNKVKLVPVFNDIKLGRTADLTQTAANRVVVDSYYSDTLNLILKYTTGSQTPSSSPTTSPSSSISASPSSSVSGSASSTISHSASSSISGSASYSSSVSSSPSVSSSASSSPSASISSSISSSPSSSISSSPSSSISSSISSSPSSSSSTSTSISSSPSSSISASPSASTSPGGPGAICYVKAYGYIGTKTNGGAPYTDTDSNIQLDTANWIQLGEHAISSGTATYTPTIFQVVGTAYETLYTASFTVDICYPKLYFVAYEEEVNGERGSLTAVALIQ